ncbi:MATE family efflux transporter [Sporolactobacillus laevolacticus]|uniref:Probable multidrug resistance protein NorM n=1 Tax=Sporolactobacillus laevolacticus DSM 442 TaxID=1395513 RepID=V6IX69_9BACL|nr:MATE family efflux transporter [Sporolactobacillus laevolacticus]EST11206.1 multidrug transporter MATE [Sporolactobacillus laevolacticus DSM 442]
MTNTFQLHIKPLNQLAVPLIANSIFGLSIELIDQAMVGHLSVSAYASVGAVGNFLYTIAGIVGAIAITLNIYGSKAIGEHRQDKYLNCLSSSLILDLLLGLSFGVLCFLCKDPLLRTIYGFSGSALRNGTTYLSLMSGYLFLQLVIFTLTNCLKIKKRTQWILIVSTTTTLLHTGLNYMLIFGKFGFPRLGVSGAALSSTVTLCLDVLIYAFILRKDIQLALAMHPNKVLFIAGKSLPLMGQELLQGSLFVIALNAMLAHLSPLVLSGYLLVGQFLQIGLIPAFMYSSALLTLVSESHGSGHATDLVDYPKVAAVLTMALFALAGFLFYEFRVPLAGLITNNQNLVTYSSSIFLVLWLANLFNPLFEIFKAAMQSVGRSTYVLIITFIIHAAALILMLILTFAFQLGIYGIAISLMIDYLAIFVSLNVSYLKVVQHIEEVRMNG